MSQRNLCVVSVCICHDCTRAAVGFQSLLDYLCVSASRIMSGGRPTAC